MIELISANTLRCSLETKELLKILNNNTLDCYIYSDYDILKYYVNYSIFYHIKYDRYSNNFLILLNDFKIKYKNRILSDLKNIGYEIFEKWSAKEIDHYYKVKY